MDDLIRRQAALDTIMGQPPEPHYPSWYAAQIEKLPAVQPATNCSEIPNGSDDTISRQSAIDALARMMPRSYTPDGSHPADEEIFRAQEIFADCIEALEILPSAQPKGHWILVHPLQEDDTGAYMCSERKVGNWEIDPESYFFCPHCGADMRGDQNE